nr:pyrroloquinoline quinone biosynthesis protein PqqB [Rhodovibrio sodomensis]
MIVLGAAAGGGFPQWNCACGNCRRARTGDPAAPARTQSSLAVSADGAGWLVLNASPDLRQQIQNTPALHPRADAGLRDSPIAAVAVTNGDVDHTGGLINLREGWPFSLYAHARLHATLDANPIFQVLNPEAVTRRDLPLDVRTPILDGAGAEIGLTVETFAVPGKVPLYQERGRGAGDYAGAAGDTVAVRLIQPGSDARVYYVPNCADLDPATARRLEGADLVFFDGTLYRDDEMRAAGLGHKTGRRMGHMPVAGPDGSLAALAGLGIKRSVYVHINNSNPILCADTHERAAVEAAGWDVAADGMEFEA